MTYGSARSLSAARAVSRGSSGFGHEAARSIDRYIRVRARHGQAYRPQLWLGVNNRAPMTASGIYQMVARRGRQCGVGVYPHRFRHYFSHTWLDRDGAEGDLMELNGWSSRRCCVGMAPARGAPGRSAATIASWRTSHDRWLGAWIIGRPQVIQSGRLERLDRGYR